MERQGKIPRRLKVVRINLSGRAIPKAMPAQKTRGEVDSMEEWHIAHNVNDDLVRRHLKIFLRGGVHRIGFSMAVILDRIRGGKPVAPSDLQARFTGLGLGQQTVKSTLADARRFLRLVFGVADEIETKSFPSGVG